MNIKFTKEELGINDAVAYDEEFKEYMPTRTYEASEIQERVT